MTVLVVVVLFLMIWGRESGHIKFPSLVIPPALGVRIRRPAA